MLEAIVKKSTDCIRLNVAPCRQTVQSPAKVESILPAMQPLRVSLWY